jgi:uncharacterized protein (DUF1684 family)
VEEQILTTKTEELVMRNQVKIFSAKGLALLLVCMASCIIISSCSSCGANEDDEEKLSDVPATATEIEKMRAEKDKQFKYDKSSPIPEVLRKSFGGLLYFPYDDKYNVIASLDVDSKPDTLRMPASGGDIRLMIKVGTFSFSIGDDETVYKLAGYKTAGSESQLILIPFKDKTTGNTTYEAGRYIEFEDKGGDEFIIDFNTAYNPYCAYSESYSCLLCPPQNVLNTSINAGEKKYKELGKGEK